MEFLITLVVAFVAFVIIFLIALFVCSMPQRDDDFHWTPHNYDYHYTSSHHASEPEQTPGERFGKMGEAVVFGELEEIVKRFGGYVYREIALEDEDGYSTEMDCVLICSGGFFVIEVKANKGTIIGNPEEDFWTAIKEEWQENKQLKNPIKQNRGHINHLRRMAGQSFPRIESLVIFPFADLHEIDSPIVRDLQSALDFIRIRISTRAYKKETVERFNKQFLSIVNRYQISHERHLHNLRNKYLD